MGSQCNALDRLAPHHQLSHHHNHRHLRRWFWQNSLRCFPYTSFTAQCSPPSYEEARLRGTRRLGSQCFSSDQLHSPVQSTVLRGGQIERDETIGQPVLFLGHGGENRCNIGRMRNTLCKAAQCSEV